MQTARRINKITKDEYLQGELISKVKHKLIDGYAYAMAGASKNHERISGNLYRKIGNHLETSPCEPFGSDIKVKVSANFFYPDVIVVCNDKSDNEYYTEFPVIIVEVLSRTTRRTDETLKRQNYLNIPTLQEYVLIEQDIVDIEVVRRNDGWRSKRYYMGDVITFDSISLSLPVEGKYSVSPSPTKKKYGTHREKQCIK